jgi:hypothetical protein
VQPDLGHFPRLRPAEHVRIHIADRCDLEFCVAAFDLHATVDQRVDAVESVARHLQGELVGSLWRVAGRPCR